MPIAGGGPGGPVGCTGPPTTGGGGIGGATPPVLLTVVDVRCCFVEDRLDVPEVVVFVVGVVGAATVVEPSKLGINGAVVAGGATTFPLLRLTAPKADVMVDSEVAEVVPGVGVAEAACPPTVVVKFA